MVSLVVPIYKEEEIIHILHDTVQRVMKGIGDDWEVVYVDDGSTDNSLNLLLEQQTIDPHVRVVQLSRNWGHQSALTAGLSVAKGDAIILMDGDLQDPPEVIYDMMDAWHDGAEVVIAQRRSRAEGGLRGKLFPIFYKVMGGLSDFPIPLNAGIFGLLDRKAVDSINHMSESNRYLPGMRSYVGFKTKVVYYDRHERVGGEPKQNFKRLFKYSLDAILSFSYKPLRMSLALGGIAIGVAGLLALALIIATLAGAPLAWGPLAIILSVIALGGIQLVGIGILGEYIGRIYDEVRRRPLFLISKVHEMDARTALKPEMVMQEKITVMKAA